MKQHLTLRMEAEEIAKLRARATAEGRTVTDVVTHVLQFDSSPHLSAKIRELEAELAELRAAHERATGRRLPRNRRVTVRFTEDEYRGLLAEAVRLGLPKTQLIHDRMTAGRNTVPHMQAAALPP